MHYAQQFGFYDIHLYYVYDNQSFQREIYFVMKKKIEIRFFQK